MCECFVACIPATVQAFQSIAKLSPICLVFREYMIAAPGQIVMMLYCFRIEATKSGRVAQVIQEQAALLGNLIEGNSFDAQSGLLGGTVTGRFGGAQFYGLLLSDHSTRRVL